MPDWIDEAAKEISEMADSDHQSDVWPSTWVSPEKVAAIIRGHYEKHKVDNFQAWCNEQADAIKRQFGPKGIRCYGIQRKPF